MHTHAPSSPLMRVVRTPLGRYRLQVGLAMLDLGPGEIKKLHRLLKTAVDDYADSLAEDACGVDMSGRLSPHQPPDIPLDDEPPAPSSDDEDDA